MKQLPYSVARCDQRPQIGLSAQSQPCHSSKAVTERRVTNRVARVTRVTLQSVENRGSVKIREGSVKIFVKQIIMLTTGAINKNQPSYIYIYTHIHIHMPTLMNPDMFLLSFHLKLKH